MATPKAEAYQDHPRRVAECLTRWCQLDREANPLDDLDGHTLLIVVVGLGTSSLAGRTGFFGDRDLQALVLSLGMEPQPETNHGENLALPNKILDVRIKSVE